MRTMAYVSMMYQLILTERKINVCNLCENSYVTAHMTCVHLFDNYTKKIEYVHLSEIKYVVFNNY